MGVAVIYGEDVIAQMSDSGTKTLKTAGKYCTNDVCIQYESGGSSQTQTKTVTPNAAGQTVLPDTGYLLQSVVVQGDADLVAGNIKQGVDIFGVTGTYSGGTTPSGTISITNNGTVDVSAYASANVNVSAATAFGAHNGWKIAKFVTVASDVGNGVSTSIDIGVSNATQIMLICMSVSSRSIWGMQVAHFTPTSYTTAGVLSLKPSTGQTYGSSNSYIGSVSYSGSTLTFTVTNANGTVRAGEYLVLYQ